MSQKSIVGLITSIISILGINAIPMGGLLVGGWAVETAVLLYLIENVVTVLLVGLRVQLLSPVREAWGSSRPHEWGTVTINGRTRRQKPGPYRERGSLLTSYLLVGLVFSVASGIFIVFFLFGILRATVEPEAIRLGVAGMLAFQLFGFIWDFFLLRPLPLTQAETLLTASLGRVVLLFLAVFAGVFVALFNDYWFLWPFVVLKTTVDVGSQVKFLFGRRNGVLAVEPPASSG
jgi:hypothetical protein